MREAEDRFRSVAGGNGETRSNLCHQVEARIADNHLSLAVSPDRLPDVITMPGRLPVCVRGYCQGQQNNYGREAFHRRSYTLNLI